MSPNSGSGVKSKPAASHSGTGRFGSTPIPARRVAKDARLDHVVFDRYVDRRRVLRGSARPCGSRRLRCGASLPSSRCRTLRSIRRPELQSTVIGCHPAVKFALVHSRLDGSMRERRGKLGLHASLANDGRGATKAGVKRRPARHLRRRSAPRSPMGMGSVRNDERWWLSTSVPGTVVTSDCLDSTTPSGSRARPSRSRRRCGASWRWGTSPA